MITKEVAFRGRHDEEKIEIWWTCVERFEWFISSTDITGLCEGKKKDGWTEKNVFKDIIEWTGLGDYGKVKRATEERKSWKLIVGDLRYRYEDNK